MSSEVSYVIHKKYQQPFIKVSLSPAALAYFTRAYGDHEGKIHGGRFGPFPGLINLAAEKLPYRQYKLRKRILVKKLTILIPDSLRHAKVTEKSIIALQEALENIFTTNFYSFVDGAVDTGCSESHAVQSFLDKYDISVDDWECNAARMAYRRYKGYEK
jgi:hypothetical protein